MATATVAIVLLVAAGLKAHSLLNSRGAAPQLPPLVLWSVTIAEWLLAGILLSGVYPTIARGTTIGVLTLFAAVSAWHAANREPDCGCFGELHVSPYWAIGLDLACIGAMVLSRGGLSPGWMRWSPRVIASFAALAVVAMALGAAVQRRGRMAARTGFRRR